MPWCRWRNRGPCRAGTLVFGEMQQPLPTWEPFDRPDELLAALGVVGSELPIEVYDNGTRHTFVALGDEAAVAMFKEHGIEPRSVRKQVRDILDLVGSHEEKTAASKLKGEKLPREIAAAMAETCAARTMKRLGAEPT